MREWPVIFSGPLVRAIMDGSKTQTRRLSTSMWSNVAMHHGDGEECLLWVRECFSKHVRLEDPYYLPPDYHDAAMGAHYWADGNPEYGDWGSPKPSIHMPRWASRINLKVQSIRLERLQDVSEDDAQAEGVVRDLEPCDHARRSCAEIGCLGPTHKAAFCELWDSLHGKRGTTWADNPEVYRIEFSRMDRP